MDRCHELFPYDWKATIMVFIFFLLPICILVVLWACYGTDGENLP